MRVTVVAAALCLIGCQPARSPQREIAPTARYRYPAWFVEGATAPSEAAVGYAPRYVTRALSESLAVVDAAARQRAHRGIRYRAEGAFAALAGESLAFAGERMMIDTLHSEATATLAVLATAETDRMTVALFGAPDARVVKDVRDLPPVAPAWVSRPPQDAHWAVVVGFSEATYREDACWSAAEDHGVQQLATTVAVRLRSLAVSTPAGRESVLDARTDVHLRDIHVLARWRDECRCAVLMRARGSTGDAL